MSSVTHRPPIRPCCLRIPSPFTLGTKLQHTGTWGTNHTQATAHPFLIFIISVHSYRTGAELAIHLIRSAWHGPNLTPSPWIRLYSGDRLLKDGRRACANYVKLYNNYISSDSQRYLLLSQKVTGPWLNCSMKEGPWSRDVQFFWVRGTSFNVAFFQSSLQEIVAIILGPLI